MVTIEWCKGKNKGIQLIEPNQNLYQEYMQTAQETLDILRAIKGKSRVWVATTKYYCEYFAFYSLLMKIGIKCEIHDCTIALCKLLESKEIIPQGYSKILEDDKQLRIDNQYYLKNRDVPLEYSTLVDFVLAIKDIATKLTNEKIEEVRKHIQEPTKPK